MRHTRLLAVTSAITAALILFTGCFSFKLDFDLTQMDGIGGTKFTDALEEIGIGKDKVDYYVDYVYFDDTAESRFDVEYSLSTETDKTLYFLISCTTAEEAKRLFDYEIGPMKDAIENGGGSFTGRIGDYEGDDGAYYIVDGEYTEDDTYYIIYSATILKDNKVLHIALDSYSESVVADGRKEINAFTDALGIKVF